MPMFLISRPLRSTDADGRRYFVSATCGDKNSNRFAIQLRLLPERHAAFAWAELVLS